MTFKIGDRVIIYDYHSAAGRDGEVVKIGRRLLTINSVYGEEKFGMADQTGLKGGRFQTPEQQVAQERRWAAWRKLKQHGLERHYTVDELPLEILERIVAVLEEGSDSVC